MLKTRSNLSAFSETVVLLYSDLVLQQLDLHFYISFQQVQESQCVYEIVQTFKQFVVTIFPFEILDPKDQGGCGV